VPFCITAFLQSCYLLQTPWTIDFYTTACVSIGLLKQLAFLAIFFLRCVKRANPWVALSGIHCTVLTRQHTAASGFSRTGYTLLTSFLSHTRRTFLHPRLHFLTSLTSPELRLALTPTSHSKVLHPPLLCAITRHSLSGERTPTYWHFKGASWTLLYT
jgi:hypothetical protein